METMITKKGKSHEEHVRLIAIDYNNPNEANWKDVIPESDDALRNISVVGNKIFASYLHNASSLIKVFTCLCVIFVFIIN